MGQVGDVSWELKVPCSAGSLRSTWGVCPLSGHWGAGSITPNPSLSFGVEGSLGR